MKTAYAYARFSSDNQREESISAQLRAINEYCDRNDIIILQVFKDEAFSARTDKRPEFQRMFGILKERPADYVIVHKLDRFARNRAVAAFYRGKLKDAGMKLVSVLERLDESPESIIMEGLLDSLNEYYSANLSRETKKGLHENIHEGKRNGGKAPIGYNVVDQHLVPNGEAEKVKRIFDMYAEGKSYKEMMEYSGWPHANIRNMLSNEVYLGHLVFGSVKHENAHEAIVDLDTWNACRRRMSSANGNASNRAKYDYMLSRMLICGKCKKPMIGLSSSNHLYYSCRTKGCKFWRKEELEDLVCTKLSEKLRPTQAIKDDFYARVAARANRRVDVEAVNKANADIQKRIRNLLNGVQYADTAEEAKAIFEQVKELRSKMVKLPEPRQISREACDDFIEHFYDFSDKPYDLKKTIIRKTLCKIVVNGEELHLFTDIQGEVYGIVIK